MSNTSIRTAGLAASAMLAGGLVVTSGPAAVAAGCDADAPPAPAGYTCEDSDRPSIRLGQDSYLSSRVHWYLKDGTTDQYTIRITRARLCVRDDRVARVRATLTYRYTNGAEDEYPLTVRNNAFDSDRRDTCRSFPRGTRIDPAGPTSLRYLNFCAQRQQFETGRPLSSLRCIGSLPEAN